MRLPCRAGAGASMGGRGRECLGRGHAPARTHTQTHTNTKTNTNTNTRQTPTPPQHQQQLINRSKLAVVWHPDKHPGDKEAAVARFQEIAAAYAALMSTSEDDRVEQLEGR